MLNNVICTNLPYIVKSCFRFTQKKDVTFPFSIFSCIHTYICFNKLKFVTNTFTYYYTVLLLERKLRYITFMIGKVCYSWNVGPLLRLWVHTYMHKSVISYTYKKHEIFIYCSNYFYVITWFNVFTEKKNRENALNNEVHITTNPEPIKGPPTISPKQTPDNVIVDDSALSWRRSNQRPNSQSFSK